MLKDSWKKVALIVSALIILAVLCAPAVSAADKRIKLKMDEPYEINGTLYQAGNLSFRELSVYNPTTTIQEVWVNNEFIGLMKATSLADTEKSRSDHLIFGRNPDSGYLELFGIAFRGERAREIGPISRQ